MNLVGENLSYKLTEELQLRKISFNFEKGRLYTILGRTLSGKTTLLKTIAGLLMPDSGSMRFEDKNFLEIPVWKRNIAMVYQQFINYPHLNVFENIAFPLKQRSLDPQKINDEVFNSLKLVGLEGYEKRKIQELSGGQQQRVSVARSLVKNAKILLLDEPLVNLDYKLREQLREEFKNIFINGLSEESIVIFSTTDPREAMELNGEVIVLDEGRVLQVGAAKEIFENPKTLKVAEISNDPPMNILRANIDSNQIKFEDIEIDIPDHLSKLKNRNFNFGIRASDVELNDDGFEFEVELAEISGSETLLHLTRGNAKIITSIEEVMDFKIRDKVKINFKSNKAYAFDEIGNLASSPFGGSSV
ncbi:ABC transporter ATP-binding protein [Candidatus Pelagibacter sp.]|nr:ABC transporter ATP-binding protein [Candidatus Pelagibacter sp.]